jgi:glycerate 2-kinase
MGMNTFRKQSLETAETSLYLRQIFIAWVGRVRMIRNRNTLETSREHVVALDCIEDAITAAAPENATRSSVSLDGETLTIANTTYDLSEYEELVLVGGGKAAGGITHALESLLGEWSVDGLIITKQAVDTTTVRNVTGDHPLPSQRNVDATTALLELVNSADEDTFVLFVLTGGASALLSAPADDLTLNDLQETTERLLEGGVPIEELNAVRKHLSESKGGQFARRAAPATVTGLLLSDVVGNDLSTIGSGPTVPDKTTFADALAVFDRHDIDPPAAIRDHLKAGVNGQIPETPFPDDPVFDTVANHLIGDNGTALDAARSIASDTGYEILSLSSRLRGEAREVAKTLVAIGEEIAVTGNPVEPPVVVLGGGECTVSITEDRGQGGPNQELILSGALELEDNMVLAAVDTDGEDGSADVAGAITDAEMVTDTGLAREHLNENDAGTYLSERGAMIETGPTGTNVNDIVVLVVPEQDT